LVPQDDGELIAVALEALAQEQGFRVDPSSFSPPANARVERFLPHGPLAAPRSLAAHLDARE
jgi:hypothetical protein